MQCKKCGKEFDFPYLTKVAKSAVIPYDVYIPICPYCHARI